MTDRNLAHDHFARPEQRSTAQANKIDKFVRKYKYFRTNEKTPA